jgi:hypothetical protein
MIEGGGLGTFLPEEVGPAAMQARNGVVDILVTDEEEAVRVAKQYLSYFQGRLSEYSVPDQLRLRHVIPENRLRVYDIKDVLEALADKDSILELRYAQMPAPPSAMFCSALHCSIISLSPPLHPFGIVLIECRGINNIASVSDRCLDKE